MYHSHAMTSTVWAWVNNHKRTVTIYKTDGQLLWVKGELIGMTTLTGSKVVVFRSSSKGCVLYKAIVYARTLAHYQIYTSLPQTDPSLLHTLWSLSERLHPDPMTHQLRFHYICTSPPNIVLLNGGLNGGIVGEYKPKASSVFVYCPNCHCSTPPLKEWKMAGWGVWGKKCPWFPAIYHKNCHECGGKGIRMSKQGAKLWWMAIKPIWTKNSPTDTKHVDDAIQKGL